VALDVDGTILDMDGRVSERVMASIARLRAHEVPVVISTGRGIAAAMPVRGFIKHYRDEFVHHVEHKTCLVPTSL